MVNDKQIMPKMIDRICLNKNCQAKFQARAIDVKRGWGRYCSKRCKAIPKENKTGQYARYKSMCEGDNNTFEQAHLFCDDNFIL